MSKNFVLIPSIATNEENSCLLTAYTTLAPNEKGIIDNKDRYIITSILRTINLNIAGDVAVEKVCRLLQNRDTSWLYKLLLNCSEKTLGRSCELGFSLALLLSQKSVNANIVATGQLGNGKGKIINIEAVKGIPDKLELVIKERSNGMLKNEDKCYFFTPIKYIEEDKLFLVEDLIKRKAEDLEKHKIEVIPVATLNEIVDRLNLLPLIPKRYLRLLTLASLGIALIATANYIYYSLKQPVPSRWVRKESGFGEQPFSACAIGKEKYYSFAPIKGYSGNNIVYVLEEDKNELNKSGLQDFLAGYVELSPNWIAKFLKTYYVSFIDINANTGLVTQSNRGDIEKRNDFWQIRMALLNKSQPPSPNVIFVLATENPPEPMLNEIKKSIEVLTTPLDLDLIINDLAKYSVADPLLFKYTTVINNEHCDKKIN